MPFIIHDVLENGNEKTLCATDNTILILFNISYVQRVSYIQDGQTGPLWRPNGNSIIPSNRESLCEPGRCGWTNNNNNNIIIHFFFVPVA